MSGTSLYHADLLHQSHLSVEELLNDLAVLPMGNFAPTLELIDRLRHAISGKREAPKYNSPNRQVGVSVVSTRSSLLLSFGRAWVRVPTCRDSDGFGFTRSSDSKLFNCH